MSIFPSRRRAQSSPDGHPASRMAIFLLSVFSLCGETAFPPCREGWWTDDDLLRLDQPMTGPAPTRRKPNFVLFQRRHHLDPGCSRYPNQQLAIESPQFYACPLTGRVLAGVLDADARTAREKSKNNH